MVIKKPRAHESQINLAPSFTWLVGVASRVLKVVFSFWRASTGVSFCSGALDYIGVSSYLGEGFQQLLSARTITA